MNKSDILMAYGQHVLQSELFETAGRQKHHFRSDVASHSINTAMFCISFYRLLGFFKVDTNIKSLVIAALAHDLGILGRYEKYSSGYECLKGHPKDSAATLQEILPGMDPAIYDAISCHMFPLCATVPRSKEAWILSIADKCAALTDLFRHYTGKQLATA